jgi:hypothetical protein
MPALIRRIRNEGFRRRRLEWNLRLPPDEARARLGSCLAAPSIGLHLSTWRKTIYFGRVKQNRFWIRRISPLIRNSFDTGLYGSISSGPHGSRIQAQFRMYRHVQVFVCYWFAFLIVWTALACFYTVGDVEHGVVKWGYLAPFAGIPFAAVGYASVLSGRVREGEIVRFLKTVFRDEVVRSRDWREW